MSWKWIYIWPSAWKYRWSTSRTLSERVFLWPYYSAACLELRHVTHLHFSQSLFLLSVHSRFRCLAPERAGWSQSLCSQTPCVYGYGLLAGTAAWQVGPVPETILRHRRQEQRIHILFLFDCGDPFSPKLPEQKYSLALISVLSMYLNLRTAHDIFLTAKAL